MNQQQNLWYNATKLGIGTAHRNYLPTRGMMMYLRALYLLFVGIMLSGCTANLNISLDAKNIKQGTLSSVESKAFIVKSFVDMRPDKERIGVQRNGYGAIVGDILSVRPVEDVVRESVVNALLVKNGHTTQTQGGDFIISGNIKKFRVKINGYTHLEVIGKVATELVIHDAESGATVFKKTFSGHYSFKSAPPGFGPDALLEKAAKMALADMIRQMSTDQELVQALQF